MDKNSNISSTPVPLVPIDEGHKQQQELSRLHLKDLWRGCGFAGVQSIKLVADAINSLGICVVSVVICLLLELSYYIGLLRAEADKEPQRKTPVYFIAFWLLVVVVIWVSIIAKGSK